MVLDKVSQPGLGREHIPKLVHQLFELLLLCRGEFFSCLDQGTPWGFGETVPKADSAGTGLIHFFSKFT